MNTSILCLHINLNKLPLELETLMLNEFFLST